MSDSLHACRTGAFTHLAGRVEGAVQPLLGPRVARVAARRERLARGKPFEAFLEEWPALRPPPAALRYSGRWPDGAGEAPVQRM